MEAFLWWIGLYNLLGPLVLGVMHREAVADFMLRRATEVVAIPYRHGSFGRMWLWWAATANGALGAIMMFASRWPEPVQREVCWAVLGCYVAMYIVVLVGGRGAKFGRGIPVVHGLWLAQIGWVLYLLWL